MSWICKNCETENSDSIDICEVCGTSAPIMLSFKYEKRVKGSPIDIYWEVSDCDSITLIFDGEAIDVSGHNRYAIESLNKAKVGFILSNIKTTPRTFYYDIDFIDPPTIDFVIDKPRLKRNVGDYARLTWSVKRANSVFLYYDDFGSKVSLNGSVKISPKNTLNCRLEVLALDNITIITKVLSIHVFDECEIAFGANRYFVYPSIPVQLNWNVKNAKTVWLNNEEVLHEGARSIEVYKDTSFVLVAEDEFSKKEKKIDVQVLPLPKVKALLMPVPNIISDLSLTVKQPTLVLNGLIHKVEIETLRTELPQCKNLIEKQNNSIGVRSIKHIGFSKEFLPPIKGWGLKRALKRIDKQLNDYTNGYESKE